MSDHAAYASHSGRRRLRHFPVIGPLRYWLEAVGPELRQYIVTDNNEEPRSAAGSDCRPTRTAKRSAASCQCRPELQLGRPT